MRIACFAVVCLTVSVFSIGVAAQKTVPAEYRGRWVAAKGACESPAAMVVAADRVTLINGKDTETLGDIEMAGPGWFPPDYRGIMAVLQTEFSGQQPAIITFNLGEKKGVGQAEFSPVTLRPNAPVDAYNARILKLNLAKRFPLDKVPLKKCA